METPSRIGTPAASVGGEIARLIELAWPVALAQLGLMLLGVVDVAMVGRLGEGALAGVMLGHTWSFSVQALLIGAAIGVEPLFSQAFGAREPDRAGDALVRATVLLSAMSLPIVLLHLAAGPVLGLAGQPVDATAVAHDYAVVRALGVPPLAVLVLLRSLLQARGRMIPGAVAIGIGNLVNVLANGVLVLGWFGVTPIGAVGAAWASVLSGVVMMVVLLALGLDLVREVRPRWARGADLRALGPVSALALPVSAQVALESWGFSVSTLLMGWLGQTALAAHAVTLTLASLAFMLPLGISSAASARVGNLIGARQPWGRASWVAIGLGAAVMLGSGAAFAFAPLPLARLFSPEPHVVALAAVLLPVAAGFGFFDGVQVVTFGVLRGAGDTAVPAAANVVGYYLVGLPLGSVLAFGFGFGAVGLWLGLLVALAAVAALLALRLTGVLRRGVARLV